MKDFKIKYGQYALITGASSGIGKEIAIQLANKGLNLILVARRISLLDRLANNLRTEFNIDVKTIKIDLLNDNAFRQIEKLTSDLEIGLLVNNAGLWKMGEYLNIPIEDELKMIDLNIKAPAILTHHFAEKMIHRGKGGIINIASLLGYVGVPYSSVYGATKAYELSKSEGLWFELKKKGIDVLSVNPGLTKSEMTDNFDFSHMPTPLMDPKIVAISAVNSLGKKSQVVPGLMNKFLSFLSKRINSRDLNTEIFGGIMKKTYLNTSKIDSKLEYHG